MGILLQFKRFFHDQCYLPIIVIHVQLFSFQFNGQETASKKEDWRINLINTWPILISSLLKYFTVLLHEATYLKE